MSTMPGIPLVARESTYFPRTTSQMCRQDAHVGLSDEEEIAAQQSLSVYCKPVEFYNILKCRSERNPPHLQRCLSYKIQAKHKMRIHLTINVPEILNTSGEALNLFPLCVLLGRRAFDDAVGKDSHDYHNSEYYFSRLCMLKSSKSQGKFVLPEVMKFAEEARSGSLDLLFVCRVEESHPFNGTASPDSLMVGDGYSLYGKLSLDLLFSSWERSQSWISHQAAEMTSVADLYSSFLKWDCTNESKKIVVQIMNESAKLQIQANISAVAVGSKERSSYDACSLNSIPGHSSARIMRLRAGNVIFNYRYYNDKLQKTEVTEDFRCPFCLVKCASFKGLRCHLPASHDLFNFDFWVNEDHQAVNISVKADKWGDEILEEEADPKQQTFFFRSRSLKRRRRRVIAQNGSDMRPSIYKRQISSLANGSYVTGASSATVVSYEDLESVQSGTMLQFIKTPKLHVDRSDSRYRTLLHRREFFHSQRAQPMERSQVLCEEDSEDDVDDYISDLEDRRMLDDFVDVTTDEKQLMHMWNSFVRKQRVLADGHVPWACEAFSNLHKNELASVPALKMCWKLFLIKLWNHGLLDARTMNSCNLNLEQCETARV
uniref:Embryonic flower 2 n=1 Tax=Kalanchoe fedtschenkoi TaxID=63787 RepID=A0A7N0TID2_KALFE